MEGLIRRLSHRLIHLQVHLLIILLIHYISTGGRLLNVMMALKCLRRIAIMLLLRLVIYMKPLGSIFDFSLQSCSNPGDPCGCFVWFFYVSKSLISRIQMRDTVLKNILTCIILMLSFSER